MTRLEQTKVARVRAGIKGETGASENDTARAVVNVPLGGPVRVAAADALHFRADTGLGRGTETETVAAGVNLHARVSLGQAGGCGEGAEGREDGNDELSEHVELWSVEGLL